MKTDEIQVKFSVHKFEKTNLVTKLSKRGGYDTYKCSECGCEGKRYGVNEYISVTSKSSLKLVDCIKTVAEVPAEKQTESLPDFTPIKVRLLINIEAGGATDLKSGQIVNTCPPPTEYKDKGWTWIWSESIKEPVRILGHEYKIKNQ